jgi:hypothetical protein
MNGRRWGSLSRRAAAEFPRRAHTRGVLVADIFRLRRRQFCYRGVITADAAEAGPVPTPFMAVTVNEYKLPMSRPVNVSEVDVDEKVMGV